MDKLQPIPQDQIKEGHAWRDWLFHLRERVNAGALTSNVVTSIVAGTNVTISPVTGLGDVTVNVTDSDTTGTVTLVSVTTANGVSGSVANNSTTPAITLTLGAITPSSIVATGAVSGTNLSGTNTGDNATNSQYSGLAGSKQDLLVSATNIKTINSSSLLGAGDLVITAAASPWPTIQNSTLVSDTVTIAAGFQMIVARTFNNVGNIINNGDMIIL